LRKYGVLRGVTLFIPLPSQFSHQTDPSTAPAFTPVSTVLICSQTPAKMPITTLPCTPHRGMRLCVQRCLNTPTRNHMGHPQPCPYIGRSLCRISGLSNNAVDNIQNQIVNLRGSLCERVAIVYQPTHITHITHVTHVTHIQGGGP
jgi:hypothetical protein